MVKNSFSLLETILAITIIALLVSGFLKFTYPKEVLTNSSITVSNDFKNPNITLPHQTSYFNFSINNTQLVLESGNTLKKEQYEDDNLLFTRYSTLLTPRTISYKEFE